MTEHLSINCAICGKAILGTHAIPTYQALVRHELRCKRELKQWAEYPT